MSADLRPLDKKATKKQRLPKPRKKITFAAKLVQWRVEMQRMAEMLMDDDQFERAQALVGAAVIIKDLHEAMAQDSYDEEEWTDE